MKRIIDVSSWQHAGNKPIDWAAVAGSGVEGVIVKATQGLSYVNPWFAPDYHGATAAGLVVGAYHYCTPAESAGADQVNHFLSVTAGLDLRLGRWLDLEESGGKPGYELHNWAVEAINTLGTAGPTGGVYTNISTAKLVGGLEMIPLVWLANPSNLPTDLVPVISQTGQGPVPGISGNVDIDVLNNDRWVNAPHGGPSAPQPTPAPTPTSSPLGQPTVEMGDTGDVVKGLQDQLDTWGVRLQLDGVFGPLTKEAVCDYQAAHDLTMDGIVGPLTWDSLDETPIASVPLPAVSELPYLSEGARWRFVVTAQWCLSGHGHPLSIDGVFGRETDATVRAFQRDHNLAVDGIVGPITWSKLIG